MSKIEAGNFYENFYKDKESFNFSNYQKTVNAYIYIYIYI